MAVTAFSIVQAAARRSGIMAATVDPLDPSDFQDGYDTLGDMLASWNDQRWMSWHLLDIALTSTGQTTPYTVGPAAQFAVNPRPARIEGAYLRQIVNAGLPIDTRLEVLPSYEEYAQIGLKTLISFPKYVFFDTAYPIGNLWIYPFPSASIYEVHILVRDVWPEVISAATSFANFPRGTIPAMKYNLARELRQNYGMSANEELNALASNYLRIVKNAQVQIPELLMPKILTRPGLYNILSDSMY